MDALSKPSPTEVPSGEDDSNKMSPDVCQQFEFIICTILIGSLCFFGLLGNVTSFFVLRKHKSETATIFLLQVLAISDSILLLCSFVVYTLRPTSFQNASEGLSNFLEQCSKFKIHLWPISLIAHTITIYVTVLVTFNRYCAVCRMTSQQSGALLRQTRLQVVALIAFAVLYNIPRFFEHHIIEERYFLYENNTAVTKGVFSQNNAIINGVNQSVSNYTYFILGDNKLYQIIYSNVLYFPVMYIIPLLSLTCLNYKLMTELKKIHEKKAVLTGHRVKDDHITLVIIVIVFVFIVCQTPALANQIFWAVIDQEGRKCGHFHFYYTKISDVLVVLNSTTNFVIYCLFGKTFRDAFMETICGKCMPKYGKRDEENTKHIVADPSRQPLKEENPAHV